jgi:hypothetical protein
VTAPRLFNDGAILDLPAGVQGRYATAESLYRWADALRDGITGIPSGAHPFLTDRIGMLRLAQRDYPGAESLFRQAFSGFKALGDSVPALEVRDVLDSLAVLYDRTGRTASADSVRRQTKSLR